MRAFDRRLGKELQKSLPSLPGLYRFYDASDSLIYVGKAKNLRRRLAQYRNAKRRKAHVKMRKIVAEAVRLEHEVCDTEFEALRRETECIQRHRPKWNTAGAFYFLYPMVGLQLQAGEVHFCYTTRPEAYPTFQFHGAYRSRYRVKEGFFALMELLRLIGHAIPKSKIKSRREGEGEATELRSRAYVYGFRQVPEEWIKRLEAFLRGHDFAAVEELSLLLLERPTAIARSVETQEHLYAIRRFWRHEILPLKKARECVVWESYPVSQRDRDLLFINSRERRQG